MNGALKKKLLTIVVILVIAFLAVFLFGSLQVTADSSTRTNERKYYTSYVVEKGDTLWDIASEYKTSEYTSNQEYIEEVITSNQLDSTEIYPGQLIILPYYADQPLY